MRVLLELGDRAEVRFFKLANWAHEGDRAVINYWYTVTYDDGSGKKTFLVRAMLERRPHADPDFNPWQVRSVSSGINPNTMSN